MKILNAIKSIVIVFVIFCLVTALIDYIRIVNAKEPVFCIKNYEAKGQVLNYRGFFYRADRTIKGSVDESMKYSYNIHYTFLFKTFDIRYDNEKVIEDSILLIDKEDCNDKFIEYLNIEGLTIYTNCIKSIKYKSNNKTDEFNNALESDPIIIDNIINKMSFMGVISPNVEKYNSKDTFTNKPFSIYRCTEYNILYITDKDYYSNDICAK